MAIAFNIESLRRRLQSADENLEEDPPDAVVAVIINSSQSTCSLLLIRRTERGGDPWSGQIAFPGGHRTSEDSSFLETAIRETNEEVGISLRDHIVLGVLPLVYARTRRVRVAPFVFQLKASVEISSNIEVAKAFWVPVKELENREIVKSKVRVDDKALTVDSYIFGENVIWGLTLRIIRIMLGRNGS